MINPDMRTYNYFTYGEDNGYGQPQLSNDVQGEIKMAIYNTTQFVQENINYKGATYVGMTHDKNVNDKYVIQYGDKKLKVLYVSEGRFKAVMMEEM